MQSKNRYMVQNLKAYPDRLMHLLSKPECLSENLGHCCWELAKWEDFNCSQGHLVYLISYNESHTKQWGKVGDWMAIQRLIMPDEFQRLLGSLAFTDVWETVSMDANSIMLKHGRELSAKLLLRCTSPPLPSKVSCWFSTRWSFLSEKPGSCFAVYGYGAPQPSNPS